MLAVLAVNPGVSAAAGGAQTGEPGFPPGYILPCSEAPKSAVLAAPAPFDQYMHVVCTRAGHALAPVKGYHWLFAGGQSMWLTALSEHSTVTGQAAHFTRLEVDPLSPAETASLLDRLKPVVLSSSMLDVDVLRMEVDTSTGDHKQLFLFVSHGTDRRAWGMECFNECVPMESPPWAFVIMPDQP